MRTTVTLRDASVRDVKRLTGKTKLSDALQALIDEEVGRRQRMAALDLLRKGPLPHDIQAIKAARKSGTWSA